MKRLSNDAMVYWFERCRWAEVFAHLLTVEDAEQMNSTGVVDTNNVWWVLYGMMCHIAFHMREESFSPLFCGHL